MHRFRLKFRQGSSWNIPSYPSSITPLMRPKKRSVLYIGMVVHDIGMVDYIGIKAVI